MLEELARRIGQLLRDRGLRLALAESCTAGLISHTVTAIPGSSDYFDRAVVAYSNEAKMELLGVPKEMLEAFGAVSGQVARAMAEGILHRSGTDVALAATGIAGPSGGTPEKPVGLVYVALAARGLQTLCQEHRFGGDRAAVKEATCQAALRLLLEYLEG